MCVSVPFIVNVLAFYAIEFVVDFGLLRQHQNHYRKLFPFISKLSNLKALTRMKSVTFAAKTKQNNT